jgi:hypothetical protein
VAESFFFRWKPADFLLFQHCLIPAGAHQMRETSSIRKIRAGAPQKFPSSSSAFFNPDNPLGREMMTPASTRVGSKSRLMDYLGLI